MQFTQPIRILVVDYHRVVGTGIAELLRRNRDFEVVGHAENSEGALRLCKKHQPDIISIDIDFHGETSGLDLVSKLHSLSPQTRFIVLTNDNEEKTITEALRIRAIGYLLKNISAEELVHAIRNAYQGQSTLSPEVTKILINQLAAPTDDRHSLTQREQQVLELISRGLTNNEIALELSISFQPSSFM